MLKEKIVEILSDDTNYKSTSNAELLGLNLISKYCKNVISGAEHDIIFSASVSSLAKSNITEEEIMQLSEWGWFAYDNKIVAHFV